MSDNSGMFPVSQIAALLIRYSVPLALGFCGVLAVAQAPLGQVKFELNLPAGASSKKANEFLATLRPAASVQTLENGNDLLLDFPSIAAAGPIKFKVVSTIPRTDGLWLLSLSPQPESGASLFAAVTLEPSALPEVNLLLTLNKTQTILLIARAGGKYYGLLREIKIGQQATLPMPK